MNPEETNPMANPGAAGAGGMSSGPVDFTANSDAKLSMADSLASAEDNLTSAGLAAKTSGSDAIGLDQIGASDPTATMARPDEPLTPAAPMPGSIGSAMSGPSLDFAPLTMPSASTSTSSTAPVNPFAPSASASSMASTETPVMPAVPVASSQTAPVTSATPATSGASEAMPMMSSTSSQNPGYNPFAMSEPAPVQPKVDMGAAMRDKKKPNVLMVVLIGLVAVLMVAVVVLAVLWQQAVNNPTIKYIQTPVEEQPTVQEPEVTSLNCTQIFGVESLEGMAGIVSMTRSLNMDFAEEGVQAVSLTEDYLFTDALAAQGMAPLFDQMVAGVGAELASYAVDDVYVHYYVNAAGEQVAMNAQLFALPVDETGRTADAETVRAAYEGIGYTCTAE